jgi:peptidoglycan/xylan/chitin deacetylase (PgdA/CDA1 family)
MCTLTLDDCIREDVEKAVDVATAEAVPLTLYLPSDYSFAQRSLWSNKVVAVIQAKSRVALNGREFAVQTPKEKVAAKDFFLSYFHALTLQTSALEQLVDTWISENGIAPNELRDGLSVLSTYEVKSYAQLPHIQFESHTCSHPFLNLLSQEEILRELSQSKYDIEAITGKPVTSLCFPYGSAAIVGSVAPKIARQFYSTATTLIGGVCGPKADLYFLPRIGIYPGDGVKELAGKIYHFQTVNYLDGDKFTS